MTSYIQQNVTPTLNPYLALGIVMAAGGLIIVAMSDRKPKSTEEKIPLSTQNPST
jgi:hypothetical protein